jgi:uncharacterized protein YndB with AHSA1/START domain
MNSAVTASTIADREIVITRMLDAPPELVWQAFTDPNQVVQWWGPSGFRTTTQRMDVKPGGVWRFVMHGPDGRDYENMITYLEVVEPHRLTYKHGGDKDVEPVNFQVTVTFEPAGMNGERTLFTMRSIFASNQAREFVIREYNALEGGKQNAERLDEYLRATSGAGIDGVSLSEQPFIISRVFQALQDLLWRVWTDPTHMACWLGPTGVSIVSNKIDLRAGGVYHYGMQAPGAPVMWGKWVFREVTPITRLVFVSSFSDADGGITRHPMSAQWPLQTLSTVTFAEHAGISRGTTVVIRWIPLHATALERKTFDDAHGSMQQGWTGTLDRLQEYLPTQTA